MIPLGISAHDRRELQDQIAVDRRVRVRLSSLTLEGERKSDLTDYLLDGQVNVDYSAEVTRSLTVTLDDPKRSLPFDTDSPAQTALFLDRMLRVSYQIRVGDEWVPVPVFTGPVVKLDRDGDTVTVECQGKETLAMGACWRPITLHKGMKKTDAIQRLLSERAGEDRFDFPDRDAKLPKPVSVARQQQPWLVAKHIARGMGMQLFYDGAGTCRLRRLPQTVGFHFQGTHHVVTPPQVSYSGQVVNLVAVRGGIPKGSKKHVHGIEVAPASHPLSPHRLGRNGVPRFLLPDGQVIRDDTIKTHAEAEDVAERRLRDGLTQHVDVSFDAAPVPFLDPGDLCHVHTDDCSVTFRLGQFSLPLGTEGSPAMSVGYLRRVSLARTRRKNRK